MPHRERRGFSLLEVMVALGILMLSLLILVETQSTAALATREAERFLTATDLAEGKLTEAMLQLEQDGFEQDDVFEHGDFDDLGDDVLNLEMGDALDDYHWEYGIYEIDIALAGDIAAMASEMTGGGEGGEAGDAGAGLGDLGGLAGGLPGGGAAGLGALLSPDMISQMLGPYIREVRVRVWWGDDSEKAEELGDEVVIVTHVVNPGGELANIGAELSQ